MERLLTAATVVVADWMAAVRLLLAARAIAVKQAGSKVRGSPAVQVSGLDRADGRGKDDKDGGELHDGKFGL